MLYGVFSKKASGRAQGVAVLSAAPLHFPCQERGEETQSPRQNRPSSNPEYRWIILRLLFEGYESLCEYGLLSLSVR